MNMQRIEIVQTRIQFALSAESLQSDWMTDRAGILSGTATFPEGLTNDCLELACAFGNAMVYGVPIDEESPDCPVFLSVAEVLASAEAMHLAIELLTEDAASLEEVWSPSSFEFGEDLCASIIERRHDLWAAMIAMKAAADDDRNAIEQSGGSMSHCDSLLSKWDADLSDIDLILSGRGPQEILSSLTDFPMLENMWTGIDSHYADHLPWWLDGSLDAVAEETENEVLSLFAHRPIREDERKVSKHESMPLVNKQQDGIQMKTINSMLSPFQVIGSAESIEAAKGLLVELVYSPPQGAGTTINEVVLTIQFNDTRDLIVVKAELFGKGIPQVISATFLNAIEFSVNRHSDLYASGKAELSVSKLAAATKTEAGNESLIVNGVLFIRTE